MQDDPKLPLHNVFSENVAINCARFLQMHGSLKATALPRLDFHDNLALGSVNTVPTSSPSRKPSPAKTRRTPVRNPTRQHLHRM